MLAGEGDDLGVGAGAQDDRGRGAAPGGQKIERALQRAEVARAVGGDGELRGAGGRGRGPGLEAPDRRFADRRARLAGDAEGPGVDRDVVGAPIGERLVGQDELRVAARRGGPAGS